MGLATIDLRSLKEHTEIYKIPKFGVNRPNSKQDTAIWKCQNLQRNVWRAGQKLETVCTRPSPDTPVSSLAEKKRENTEEELATLFWDSGNSN